MLPTKVALTVWTPRTAIGNDTDANPAASVVPVSVCDSAPDIMKTTAVPAMAPVGALVRESVVLTVSELPISAVDGAANADRDVAACAIVADVVAVSAITGTAPV